MSMEKIRLLHSELSELLNIFSLSYGLLLLSFFVFNFINLMFQLFLSICFEMPLSDAPPFKIFLRKTLTLILNIQVVVFTMSIIVAVSLIHDEVKMFMLQLSLFELDEITTYGFFNINLNIVMSITVLFITGLITLIQMKNHTIMMNIYNT
ncbi:uncharacterized protein LOC111037956 [Myzus persicae]|uniref:uncharacterized protein LOC111037956 n=1 Tax=Myzus persicae TaxID=13164 RepID=UPI000B92FEC9|nr:uncharacterized protein LOC111037956 [Myzus persicae]